ncbi:hypothetical protein VDG1235_629 [Verrucomicrobiia bacterium DG1235]|nr:hypothetical protein VDG1235_629 [Verrucomicrobiae bacterium DG1235]
MTTPDPQTAKDDDSSSSHNYTEATRKFWKGNIQLTLFLLLIWAAVGLGCGVLFADSLNQYHLGGYPLGFWFAQQGSIIVFVLLILVFCIAMNRRDKKHHADWLAEKKRDGEDAS